MTETTRKDKIVGVIFSKDNCLQIRLCDKRKRSVRYHVKNDNLNGATEGDVVVIEVLSPPTATPSNMQAKVTRVLGQQDSPGVLSLISLYEKGLSETFSQAAMKEAKAASIPALQGREDLRKVPLVTIDGADARDFDDAVFAEKTADGGFHLIVAIADVSYYVTPGSDLDKEAYARGNSTYFPDRVVPMLPEALSNGLCSLKPHEDRAVLAFHMQIDKDGNMTDHKIVRALMNSAARLTYKQVQEAKDGRPDNLTKPLMNKVIDPLYAAYAALRKARDARGAMDLDMPEMKISVDADGKTIAVKNTTRMDSQRLIEEFMVLANVAAATSLEEKNAPCVYRVHGTPPFTDKVEALRKFIATFGLTLPEGAIEHASAFQDVIKQAGKIPGGEQIIKAILRVQAKAVYDTNNIGHFGLALEKYAHFTSPIRRYADLLVHRSLVDVFNLGAGGLDDAQKAQLNIMAQNISESENISAKAERSARDRMAVASLAKHVGKEMSGRIVNITDAGLFIKLDKSKVEGLLPIRFLPNDQYDLDRIKRTLTGRNHKGVYKTDAPITVRLKDADALTASILLAPANDNKDRKPMQKNSPKPPKAMP